MCRRRAIQGLVALVVAFKCTAAIATFQAAALCIGGGLNPPWATPKASPNRLFAATTNYKA